MSKLPSVILLDIETSPIVGFTWGTYDTNVLKVLQSSQIMSVAWKELNAKRCNCKALIDYPGYKAGKLDDEKLVREIWDVLDKADVVIAHYGDGFDLKKLNARFAYYGLNAPSAYKSIDTKKVSKKYFIFDNNKLDSLGSYFKLGNKVQTTGFSLWVDCMAGSPEAWSLMKKYNKVDVELLEKVYLKLRPFINNHPNLNLITDKEGCSCPSCQSTSLMKRGFTITKTGKKQRYQCQDCGSWSSGKFEKSTNILSALQ